MEISKILEQIENKKRLKIDGDKKIARVIEGETVDRLPLIFWKPRFASVPGKTYNLEEQFYNKEKMLTGHLEEIEEVVENAFDAPLCVRPNFGTIFVPAVCGLKYKVFGDKYPWLEGHLTKDEAMSLNLLDLDKSEIMNMCIEYIKYFKEILPDWIHIYHPDTQGPFDIAHLLIGDSIFYEIFDDPDYVHRLMELCTEIFIEVSHRLKEVIGEETNSCYHGHALARGIYMRNGGVRISEDTATLLSPEQIDEFVIPYDRKALAAFGGGFVHYCGKNEYLLDAYLKLDEVRTLNFGNPEMYNFDKTMMKFNESGKCYFGVWPRKEGEKLKQYIARMKEASFGGRKGLLLHFDENMYSEYSPEQILEMWNR